MATRRSAMFLTVAVVCALAVIGGLYLVLSPRERVLTFGFGTYERMTGDPQQARRVEVGAAPDGTSVFVWHYDDGSKQTSLTGCRGHTCSAPSVTQYQGSPADGSLAASVCRRVIAEPGYALKTCSGHATETYGRKNVDYTSHHRFTTVGKDTFYDNAYVFSDGSASTAVFKRVGPPPANM